MRSPKINLRFLSYFSQHNQAPLQTSARDIINLFRLALGILFVSAYLYIGQDFWWDTENAVLFYKLALAYLSIGGFLLAFNDIKPTIFHRFQPLITLTDIVFIIMLMYAAGGIQSGIGLLLIITIVNASLITHGRLALFYASIASIGLLLEQSYQIIRYQLSLAYYTQPVVLSLSCFAIAWLAYSYTKRMQSSEDLASARSIDLENLAQVNALITQQMQDGVIVVDQNFYIRHYNLSAESMLSLPKDNPQNLTLLQTAPEIGRVFYDWLKGSDVQPQSIVSQANGELKLTLMPINQLRSSGAVIFIQDWSKIQSAAQQTKLAALGRLTANIAHEIRNPLSAISHATQLLQEDLRAKEDTQANEHCRMLQIVDTNIGRIDQIIKDVLELNRRDRTQKTAITLNQFLTDFHAEFCAIEKIPAGSFILNIGSQLSVVHFDHRHLTQIIWNLCKNAWQHGQKSTGCIQLQLVETNQFNCHIEVYDDGIGVAKEDRTRLFEPFFTTKAAGNGLGLYISRELAEANGAHLDYKASAKQVSAIDNTFTQANAFILSMKKG